MCGMCGGRRIHVIVSVLSGALFSDAVCAGKEIAINATRVRRLQKQ